MYDELERITRRFKEEIRQSEDTIMNGTAIPDFPAYKVRVAELKTWQRALNVVEEIKKHVLSEEFADDN